MHKLKAILAVFGIALLPACLLGDFDDLENKETQVQSDDKRNLDVTGFGSALIPTSSAEGLSYYVVAPVAPTLLHVEFDAKGARATKAAETLVASFGGLQRLIDNPTVASDSSSFATAGSERAALGILDGNVSKVILLNADYGSPGVVVMPQFSLEGGEEPTSIVFGDGDLTPGTTDLLAVSGSLLNLIPDYQGMAPQAASCSLPPGSSTLLSADVDANNAGQELIIASGDNSLFVTSTSFVQAATQSNPPICFPMLGDIDQIAPPAGVASLGSSLARGDFDNNEQPDIVVAGSNAVYVYMNWTVQAPTAATRVPTPGGSVAFGTTLAVGDFDDDGRDELVIADPKLDIAANKEAGKAYVYSLISADFEVQAVLHDARADDMQNFGRSLAVAQIAGRDKLIVGTKSEVFTYFRTPLVGDIDFRQ